MSSQAGRMPVTVSLSGYHPSMVASGHWTLQPGYEHRAARAEQMYCELCAKQCNSIHEWDQHLTSSSRRRRSHLKAYNKLVSDLVARRPRTDDAEYVWFMKHPDRGSTIFTHGGVSLSVSSTTGEYRFQGGQ